MDTKEKIKLSVEQQIEDIDNQNHNPKHSNFLD